MNLNFYKMLTNVRHLDLKNLENVKTAFEHVSLYVGLVIFTAAGAKVKFQSMWNISLNKFLCQDIDKLFLNKIRILTNTNLLNWVNQPKPMK